MITDIKKWLKEILNEERYLHSLGAEEKARELAERFGADVDKAAFAALIHDNAKCFSVAELKQIIKENNIPVSELELKSYKTLHSPVGAFIAQKELNIEDKDILNAIRFHTVGRIDMGLIEKIVFLADKIEENTRNKDFIDKINRILDETENLDEAVLECYDATIRSLLDRKMIINPQTIDVYNSLLLKLNK